MKHLNGHSTTIHSVKHTPQGMTFVVRCCDQHDSSKHIQNAHKFSKDLAAFKRVLMTHQREVSEEHEAHLIVEQFVKENVEPDGQCHGCGQEQP